MTYPDILALVMGYITPPQTWQMKHGINSEPHAKFKQFFKKTHQNPKVSDPGMTVFKSHPFISVSPDLEINCCHGLRLVEIKCPATIIGKVPSAENYKHLEIINEQPYLKKTRPYYFQIQGQLAVTGRQYCYFFVFSFKGHLNIRVEFDEQFWVELLDNLDWFFCNFVAPELLLGKMKKNIDRICDENDIVVVEKRDCQIVQHVFENNEVTSQVSLLADIAEDLDIEIYYNFNIWIFSNIY